MSSLFRAAAAAAESLLNAADESAAAVLSTPQKALQPRHPAHQPSDEHDGLHLPPTPLPITPAQSGDASGRAPDEAATSPVYAPTPLRFPLPPSISSVRYVPAADEIDFEAMLAAEATPRASAAEKQQRQSPVPSSAHHADRSLLETISGGRDIVELLGENDLLRAEVASLRASSDASSKKFSARLSAAQSQLDEQQSRHKSSIDRVTQEAADTESRLTARVRELDAAHSQSTRVAAAAQSAAAAAELQVSVQKDSIERLQASLDEVTQQLSDAREAARALAAEADVRAASERERFLKTIAGLRDAEASLARDREHLSAAAADANKKCAAAAALAAELRERAGKADAAAAASAVELADVRLECEGLRRSVADGTAAAAIAAAAARDERSKLDARLVELQMQVEACCFSNTIVTHSCHIVISSNSVMFLTRYSLRSHKPTLLLSLPQLKYCP
jgi:hypothetical protein